MPRITISQGHCLRKNGDGFGRVLVTGYSCPLFSFDISIYLLWGRCAHYNGRGDIRWGWRRSESEPCGQRYRPKSERAERVRSTERSRGDACILPSTGTAGRGGSGPVPARDFTLYPVWMGSISGRKMSMGSRERWTSGNWRFHVLFYWCLMVYGVSSGDVWQGLCLHVLHLVNPNCSDYKTE